MKNLIFLAVLGVAGYFSYQYFIIPWLEGNATTEPTFDEYVISLPEQCQKAGESLKDAIDSSNSAVSINGYTKNFRNCLRLAGLTDSQIDEAHDSLKDSR